MIQVGEHITLARAAGLACAGRQADRLAGLLAVCCGACSRLLVGLAAHRPTIPLLDS